MIAASAATGESMSNCENCELLEGRIERAREIILTIDRDRDALTRRAEYAEARANVLESKLAKARELLEKYGYRGWSKAKNLWLDAS